MPQAPDVQYAPRVTVPIRPIAGHWSFDPSRDSPPGASTDMLNCVVQGGMLRKRPGFIRLPDTHTGFGEPVVGLYSTQDELKMQHLFAVTPTKVYKYDQIGEAWTLQTGPALTGDHEHLFSFENSELAVVFSQGVDPVMELPLIGSTYAILSANCPPAKYLCRFNGRLNIGYTLEGGTPLPYRHRRCVRGNHSDWTGLGAGFRDMDEFPYHMQNMRKLSTQMILYYERAIEASIIQPNAAAPFRYETRVADIGLYCSRTLAGRNDLHFFLGTDDFYGFNGVTPQPIGQQIRDDVFETLNTNKTHLMFGEVLPASQEYVAFLIAGGADWPTDVWVYSWTRSIWYKWSVVNHRCATIYQVYDPLTIDELIGTMDEQNWPFDSAAVQQAYPALLTGTQTGFVMQWNPLSKSDDGHSIYCRWTSQDFTAEKIFEQPGVKLIMERLTFEYKGLGTAFTLHFQFSTDGGDTWTPEEIVVAPSKVSGFHTGFVTQRVTGDRIRFRFNQDSAEDTFAISKFELEFTLQQTPEYAHAG